MAGGVGVAGRGGGSVGGAVGGAALRRAARQTVLSSVIALLVLNLLDGLFTLVFLQTGVAVEANPLMRAAYEHSPLAFMGLKLVLVQVGAAMLWTHRESPSARVALTAGVILYGGIVAYHCSFLLSLIVA